MEEAIKRLEALLAEYVEEALNATGEPQAYYDDLRSRVVAVEEGISRLRG